MPELPEVETVRRQLESRLRGHRFAAVELADPFLLLDTTPQELCEVLPGRQVEEVGRHGKFLLLRLTDDLFLTLHLGMTGQVLFVTGNPPSHSRFVFGLTGSDERLVFRDVRKFGRLHLTAGAPARRVGRMGPDAWLGTWTAADLAERLSGRSAPLKAFLLDQRHLAGIGNIYADEILFAAGLSPLRPAGSLGPRQTARLARIIREKLDEGVRLRGCSLSDFVDTEGCEGGFQRVLAAYGRAGEPCERCGRPLRRTVVGGRGTSYCPHCQR